MAGPNVSFIRRFRACYLTMELGSSYTSKSLKPYELPHSTTMVVYVNSLLLES